MDYEGALFAQLANEFKPIFILFAVTTRNAFLFLFCFAFKRMSMVTQEQQLMVLHVHLHIKQFQN